MSKSPNDSTHSKRVNTNPYSNCVFDHLPKDYTIRADYMQIFFENQVVKGFYDMGRADDNLIEKTAREMAAIRIADANKKD